MRGHRLYLRLQLLANHNIPTILPLLLSSTDSVLDAAMLRHVNDIYSTTFFDAQRLGDQSDTIAACLGRLGIVEGVATLLSTPLRFELLS